MTSPRNDQTLRLQILKHLETLKIPLKSEQVDEILAAAARSKLSHLQLLGKRAPEPFLTLLVR